MAVENIFYDGWNPIVSVINGWFSLVFPGGEVYLVALVSVLLAYLMKKRFKVGFFTFLLFSVLWFMSLRYLGVGGVV